MLIRFITWLLGKLWDRTDGFAIIISSKDDVRRFSISSKDKELENIYFAGLVFANMAKILGEMVDDIETVMDCGVTIKKVGQLYFAFSNDDREKIIVRHWTLKGLKHTLKTHKIKLEETK